MKAKLGPILIALLLLVIGWRHFHGASPAADTARNDAAERPAEDSADAPDLSAGQIAGISIPNSLLTQEFLNFLPSGRVQGLVERFSRDPFFQRLLDALGLDEGQRTALTIIYAYRAAVAGEAARDFFDETDAVTRITVTTKPRNEGTYVFGTLAGNVELYDEAISDAYLRPDAMAKAVLGEKKFGAYERFAQTFPYQQIFTGDVQSTAARNQVQEFSQAQSDQFVELMRTHAGIPPPSLAGGSEIQIPDAVIEQMAVTSTKEQVQLLRDIQTRHIDLNQAARQAVETWNAANQAQP